MNRQGNKPIKIPGWMRSNTFIGIMIFGLWLISVAFSFYVLLEFQQMILRRFVMCCSENRWGFQVVRQWTTIAAVGIWLGFVTLTGEYHYQNQRKTRSWNIFKWSYIVLIIILIIALIL